MANAVSTLEGVQRREQIHQFIIAFMKENGWAPSFEEISAAVALSHNSVRRQLRRMHSDGMIDLGPGPRMIKPL